MVNHLPILNDQRQGTPPSHGRVDLDCFFPLDPAANAGFRWLKHEALESLVLVPPASLQSLPTDHRHTFLSLPPPEGEQVVQVGRNGVAGGLGTVPEGGWVHCVFLRIIALSCMRACVHSMIDGATIDEDNGRRRGRGLGSSVSKCALFFVGLLVFFFFSWGRMVWVSLFSGKGGRGLLGCCVSFFVADNVIVGDCWLGFVRRWCGVEVWWLCAKTWVRRGG